MDNKSLIRIFFLVMFLLFNLFPFFVCKTYADSPEYVEGEHVRFLVKETFTNSIPVVSLNSSWAGVIPTIDGSMNSGEWEDAFVIPIYKYYQAGSKGNLYVKNNDERLFIAIDVFNDTSNDDDTFWIQFNPLDNEKLYRMSILSQYIESNIGGVVCQAGFSSHRLWEVSIPLQSIDFFSLKQTVSLGVWDGPMPQLEDRCYWPSLNGSQPITCGCLALANGPDNGGQGFSYEFYLKDTVKILDQAYEELERFLDYTPYNGEKISIVWNSSLTTYAGISGNPILVDSPFTLNLFFHEMAHNFAFCYPTAINEALANHLCFYLISVLDLNSTNILLNVNYETSYKNNSLTALQNYEAAGSQFNTLDFGFQDELIISGIFYDLINSYGPDIFTVFDKDSTSFQSIRFQDVENGVTKWVSIFLYSFSTGINHNIVELFIDRGNFPPISEFDWLLSIDKIGSGFTSYNDGVYVLENESVVEITASADNGWFFSYWLLDSINIGSNNPCTVSMNDDHTLTAVFTENPPMLVDNDIYVVVDDTTYLIRITSNSDINNFNFNQPPANNLNFTAEGESGTVGICNITIPSELMSGTFSIYNDDTLLVENLDYTKTSNATHYTFNLSYEHSIHNIEIFSTSVIPELSSIILISTFIVTTIALIVVTRKNRN